MIAAGLGGRGARKHRGRSAFYDQPLRAAMDALLALGPADCRSHVSSIDGRRLHYLETGSGSPLLLLHGASGGAANWYRLFQPLGQNWRVLAPDLPGFGFSEALDPIAPLGHQVARLLAEWLHSIGVTHAHVVGTSFGGLLALRLPKYFNADKLVAIDTVGIAPRLPLPLRLATLPLIARLVVSPTKAGTRAMLRRVLTATRLPAEHEQALVNYLYASAQRSDAATLARAFVRFAGVAGQRDVLTAVELQSISNRLLLVWGERDRFLPVTDVRRIAALAGCPDVRMIPNVGHSPNWENPEALAAVITDFLRR
jgi:pimeloyl-ACP methyl ester carboxylesterase